MNQANARSGKQASVQTRIVWLTIGGLLAATLAHQAVTRRPAAPVQNDAAPPPSNNPSVSAAGAPPAVTAAHDAMPVRPQQLLATVNGHPISGEDAVPFGNTNQETELSPEGLQFYLRRAVERELIFEAAQKQGIFLDESQSRQIAHLQSARNEREPGSTAKLNDSPAGRQLEILDARAFMLQTDLMAAQGRSPNVTETQVMEYFQQHRSDFANLPGDPDDRDQAWQRVAYQIRTQLADSTRAQYNNELAAYMKRIESEAEVVFNVPDFPQQ